jgi:hypothetical protein
MKFRNYGEVAVHATPCAIPPGNGNSKAKSCPTTRHAGVKRERRYSSYSFLTSALYGVSGQRDASAALYPWERTYGTHWIGGWMGL